MNQKSIQWLSAKAHIRFVNQSNKNQEYRRGCHKASSFSFPLSRWWRMRFRPQYSIQQVVRNEIQTLKLYLASGAK